MTKDFIVFGAPDIQRDEIDEVVDSMESGWLGTGPKVKQFEHDFANYKQVKAETVVALNSCTAALHTSLLAAGVAAGDEVITTAMTFCATVNSIIHSGATPVLVDVDPNSFNILAENIEKKITDKTKAIVIVHFGGRSCDMTSLMNLADKYKLKVIEDCAHAIEGEYEGKALGTFGDFGCFSFYSTKNITTGEGGMVIAKNENDAAFIRAISLHGMSKDAWNRFGGDGYKHYYVEHAGFKYNMMDIQAAIGIHQLSRIDKSLERRFFIWDKYQQSFASLPIILPSPFQKNTKHCCHLYTILVNEERSGISRDECLTRLTKMGVGAGVHYLSIAEHPFYQRTYEWSPQDYPNAMNIGRMTLSLPISSKLTDKELDKIVVSVQQLFNR